MLNLMATHLLTRSDRRAGPTLTLHDDITLALARVHEACGIARRSFALWVASQMTGPILWIHPDWGNGHLNPDGILPFTDPARLIFVQARRTEDLLWSMEEALRSGAVPLVVAELPDPPSLTPVRRLHLAGETGGTLGRAPLGLLLTPGNGGAQGIESRWHMSPAHQGAERRWQLDRRRARTLPPKSWTATQTRARTTLTLTPGSPAQHPPPGQDFLKKSSPAP